MKNFFKKIKSYGFWVSLSSALVLLATALGNAFGFEIENKIIEDIVMSIAGVLAVLGIVSMTSKKDSEKNQNNENQEIENASQEKLNNETEKVENEDVEK